MERRRHSTVPSCFDDSQRPIARKNTTQLRRNSVFTVINRPKTANRRRSRVKTLNEVISQCESFESSPRMDYPESEMNHFTILGKFLDKIDAAVKTDTLDNFRRNITLEKSSKKHTKIFLENALKTKDNMLAKKTLEKPKIWFVPRPLFSHKVAKQIDLIVKHR